MARNTKNRVRVTFSAAVDTFPSVSPRLDQLTDGRLFLYLLHDDDGRGPLSVGMVKRRLSAVLCLVLYLCCLCALCGEDCGWICAVSDFSIFLFLFTSFQSVACHVLICVFVACFLSYLCLCLGLYCSCGVFLCVFFVVFVLCLVCGVPVVFFAFFVVFVLCLLCLWCYFCVQTVNSHSDVYILCLCFLCSSSPFISTLICTFYPCCVYLVFVLHLFFLYFVFCCISMSKLYTYLVLRLSCVLCCLCHFFILFYVVIYVTKL